MSIVFITIPGNDKREFANLLHQKTDNGVSLVIIQQPKRYSLIQRLRRFYRGTSLKNLPKEIWYAILLRLQKKFRQALEHFRENSVSKKSGSYVTKVLEVECVNEDKVHEILREIKPDLMVVWGSTILQPRIVATAKKAINLHSGYCPYYRGARANQHALLNNDRQRIGTTIHYINGKIDGGDILEATTGDISKHPRDFFRELNDRSREKYLMIATRLFRGEKLPTARQEHLPGQILLLKQWTPSIRYKVAKNILNWQEEIEQ